jgi:protein-S-isoprenylcysteine O-methyltransferase Ste14
MRAGSIRRLAWLFLVLLKSPISRPLRPGCPSVLIQANARSFRAEKIMALRLIVVVFGIVAYLGLAILGWRGFGPFFSHPPLIALTVVLFAMSAAALFTQGSLSTGVREDRANRWVIAAFTVIGLALGFFPAYTDRKGFWILDENTMRWTGVAVFSIGGALRIWPVYVLGRRFSGLVAIQPGHKLVTSGIYGVIRHPSYLGVLVNALGWSLAFRSGVGVLLAASLIPPLIARIDAEEKLLHSQFGAEYEAYRARTSRLIPWLY